MSLVGCCLTSSAYMTDNDDSGADTGRVSQEISYMSLSYSNTPPLQSVPEFQVLSVRLVRKLYIRPMMQPLLHHQFVPPLILPHIVEPQQYRHRRGEEAGHNDRHKRTTR